MPKLSWGEIETNAIAFAKRWKDTRGDEKQDAQTFEKDLMSVFGVDWLEGLHEYRVINEEGVQNYIDYILPGKILIEMKSKGESLIRAYNQAITYSKCLKPDEYPELLMVSDFDQIQVTNLRTGQTFQKFKLNQLKKHIRMFGIVAGYTSEVTFTTNIEVNTDASYKMAKLHDGLKANGYTGKNLEIYLVRLLFCLFAEDTGIFEKEMFENYIRGSKEDGSDLSGRLMELFSILDTPDDKRMGTLRAELKHFRYINGNLFSAFLPPAAFDDKMRQTLLDCCDFDWSYISPAIFGAMFQGVMDEKQRRELGAHYTSEENIMKVIKPLFLDDLWLEFDRMKSTKAELESFHNKVASLRFLDPACGCGNFLIITYRELRLLEFEVLKMLHDNKQGVMIDLLCKVSVDQFYGIEYEEFPCQIAQVGLLLMKHQLDKEVSNYFGMNLIDFPIKETATIVHGNALQIDWESVISKDRLDYIIGNPPFVGNLSPEQAADMALVFSNTPKFGKLDYVCAWYKKAADFTENTAIRCAFVSTNSISQGEQVSVLWNELFRKNVHIDFAYKTFKWSNDAKGKAAVHCVIIGFSAFPNIKKRVIYNENTQDVATNISPYLIAAKNILVESRSTPLCNSPKMVKGSIPVDEGHLLLAPDEKEALLASEPHAEKYIRPFLGAREYINKQERWCIWLKGASPKEIRELPCIRARIDSVRQFRLASNKAATRKYAEQAMLFMENRQPETEYILVPRHSSENRKYIPMGFMSPEVVAGDANMVIPDATLYHFGVITSSMHMAWMRTVAGRLKSDYRYSSDIVYNNFPWPNPTEQQRLEIEKCAQAVLDARCLYPDCSLADLYDPNTMPVELSKAHRHLDRAVEKAYGRSFASEEEQVAFLFERYAELTKEK